MLPCSGWLRGSLGSLLLLSGLNALPAVADWTPDKEPADWRLVRQQLLSSGQLEAADWVFLDATRNEKVQAAEYLRDLQRRGGAVSFLGALILRRNGQTDWTVRAIKMRALCEQGVLQQNGASGSWRDYPGRPGTTDRVRWICNQA